MRPLVSVYLAYINVPDLKKVLPFKKLNPNMIRVTAITVKAPTFVSFDTRIIQLLDFGTKLAKN
jgi:hypothetical protein